MSQILAGGLLKITASASMDVNGGLFHPRPVLSITPCFPYLDGAE